MVDIRDLTVIRDKWLEVTPARAGDYKAGVLDPKRDWETETAAAEAAYEDGVTAAIADKRFGKGVREAGTEKWKRKASTLGVDRWPAGIRVAGPNYEAGFKPYHETIKATTLPPRYRRGDERNFERVRVMAMALHKKRVGS